MLPIGQCFVDEFVGDSIKRSREINKGDYRPTFGVRFDNLLIKHSRYPVSLASAPVRVADTLPVSLRRTRCIRLQAVSEVSLTRFCTCDLAVPAPSALYFTLQSSGDPLFLNIITNIHSPRFASTVSLFQTFFRNSNSISLETFEFCHTSVGIPSGPGVFTFFMLSSEHTIKLFSRYCRVFVARFWQFIQGRSCFFQLA